MARTRFTDESAIQEQAAPPARDKDGRYVLREVGCAKVANDPNFDRAAFVDDVMAHLKAGKAYLIADAADRLALKPTELLHRVEQMTWWGLIRKKAGAVLFTVGAIDLYGPMFTIHTPDGACCPTGFGWRPYQEDA